MGRNGNGNGGNDAEEGNASRFAGVDHMGAKPNPAPGRLSSALGAGSKERGQVEKIDLGPGGVNFFNLTPSL
jgi:hypothetical protein